MSEADEFVHSCSRHGSIAFEWQKNSNDAANSSNNNNGSGSSAPPTSPGTAQTSSTQGGPQFQAPDGTPLLRGSQVSSAKPPSVDSRGQATTAAAAQPSNLATPAAVVPFKIVGVLLFNPTISIDDETTESNILFSERRGIWGGAATPVPHAVPNHAGLCSGIRMLASIFGEPQRQFVEQQKRLENDNNNRRLHFASIPYIPGVRFMTQIKAVHCFVETEENFPIVVTVERSPHHANGDAALVDEITQWVHRYCDGLRTLHAPFSAMWQQCLEHQRTVTQAAVDANNLKTISKKKIEVRARVAAARDLCIKVAPMMHGLYDFVDEVMKTQYGGPWFLSHIQQQLLMRQQQQNQQHHLQRPTLTRGNSSNSLASGSIPEFGDDNNNPNHHHHHNQHSNNNNNRPPARAQSTNSNATEPPLPLPLFGPLQIAAAPSELRMSAALFCTRVLDAHISLLRHTIVVESPSVLSPQSMCTLSPTILATSLPPASAAGLLGAAGLYRPTAVATTGGGAAAFISSTNSAGSGGSASASSPGPSSPTTTITVAPSSSTDAALLGCRSGLCRFMRVIRMKGDGSLESPAWNSQRGVRVPSSASTATTSGGPEKKKEKQQKHDKPPQNGSAAASSTSATEDEEERKKRKQRQEQQQQERQNVKSYEKNELWLFQLGPHLVLCCEAKSSLLSVPGSRLSLVQNMCHFLSAQSQDLLLLADVAYGGGGGGNRGGDDDSILSPSAAVQLHRLPAIAAAGKRAAAATTTKQNHHENGSLPGDSGTSTSRFFASMRSAAAAAVSGASHFASGGGGGGGSASSSSSMGGATIDDFAHFLENSALHIGTINTHAKMFPANRSNSSGGNNNNNDRDDGGGKNASSSSPTRGSGASSGQRVGFASLQSSIVRPTDDDMHLGPPQFVMRSLLLTEPEFAAMRDESFVVAQRNLRKLIEQQTGRDSPSNSSASATTARTSFEFQDDVQRWFTRGSSTYGHSVLGCVTDRRVQGNNTNANNAGGAATTSGNGIASTININSSNNALEAIRTKGVAALPLEFQRGSAPIKKTTTGSGLDAQQQQQGAESFNSSSSRTGRSPSPTVPQRAKNNINNKNAGDHHSSVSVLLQQRKERWAFVSSDGDRVAGVVDNSALDAEEAAETGRRAMRLFGLHNSAENL